MKIFNWFQSKINGKQGTNKQNSVTDSMLHRPCEGEFSDCPIELLAIGTFGNNNSLKDPVNLNHQLSQPDHLEELTPEEVGELHKEFKLLLREQIPTTSPDSAKHTTKDLEKFFDYLQDLEDDRKCSENKESHLKQSNNVVLESTSSGIIGKKSVSYFLKKAFLYRGGFTAPPPSPLRDPISQSKFEKLRLEKILRAILHKRIVPQASNPRAT